jgi:small subunit ribosomal protein S6e
MMNFKFVISSANRSYQVEKDQKECPVLGKKIGESFSGDFLGLEGYELIITGGSDRDGFPMRKDMDGVVKKRLILTDGIGFQAEKGLRKRKMVRGNTIGLDTVQINCNVTKQGQKPLAELLGKKEEKPKEENSEEPKEEAKEEPKAEEKPKEEKPAEEAKKEEKEGD